MRRSVKMALAIALVFAPVMAFAQSDAHHPDGSPNQSFPSAYESVSAQCVPMMEMGGMIGRAHVGMHGLPSAGVTGLHASDDGHA